MLGNAVDDLTDRQCGRILCVMFATAARELERTHAHDNQLELDAAMKRKPKPRVKHHAGTR